MRDEESSSNHEQGITGYLLLMRGEDWDQGLSDEEMREVVDRTAKWFEALMKTGKVKGGNALGKKGQVVSGQNGRVLTDGPFAESKEVLGGYLLLDVPTFEEAVAIARSSPGVDYGISIEVRPVMDECPVFKRVREKLGLRV